MNRGIRGGLKELQEGKVVVGRECMSYYSLITIHFQIYHLLVLTYHLLVLTYQHSVTGRLFFLFAVHLNQVAWRVLPLTLRDFLLSTLRVWLHCLDRFGSPLERLVLQLFSK